MSKTPDYMRRAIKAYEESKDKITINTDKGTKERIKTLTGLSVNKYINDLVQADLDRLESIQGNTGDELDVFT